MRRGLIIILVIVSSCYNQRKATTQFSKAAVAYPIVASQFCAITFPPRTVTIKGDSIVLHDTLTKVGETVTDTIISFDTIRITKTVTLPSQIITRTVHITDTITVENTAQLKTCELERGKVVDLLTESNRDLLLFKGKAKTRGLVMWSLLALVVVLVGWKIYGLINKK